MISLVVPTLMLVCVLVCGAVSLVIVRARCLRGMGQGPMSSLSRDTYPTARGAAGPARPHPASSHPLRHGGVPVRVYKHGAGPRSAAAAQASPSSSLINRLAAGAPRPASPAAGGGDSGEKHSFLQELTPPSLLPSRALFLRYSEWYGRQRWLSLYFADEPFSPAPEGLHWWHRARLRVMYGVHL